MSELNSLSVQKLFINCRTRFDEALKIRFGKATITDLMPEKRRAKLHTQCFVKDVVVLDGEAVVQLSQ